MGSEHEPQRTLLIKDAMIFTGEEFIDSGYLFAVDGRISKVGGGQPPASLESDTVFSRPGDTLLPGFIDAHIHGNGGNIPSIEQSLRFGVTTVCDMQNEKENFEKLETVSALHLVGSGTSLLMLCNDIALQESCDEGHLC